MWAIFGHGNVAALGEALYGMRATRCRPIRAHNEQAMAHAAIAFAKASRRRRMMACTTSIGPGATNMVTAAAVAHVNRLPVLLLPGDVFANRRPDPVLQQVEDFADGTVSANDCFRPVSRYFDRITRPEQIIAALPRAMSVLTDPAECGPVTLALCQDMQAEAFDYPESFFAERVWTPRRIRPGRARARGGGAADRGARKKPLIIAGGGVHYSEATAALAAFAERHGIPVAETQAGKSALPHDHPLNMGAIGVTGTSAANALAARSRPGARRRHAAAGFHHRLLGAVPRSGAAHRQPQRAAVRCRQASGAAAGRATRRPGSRRCRGRSANYRAPRELERARRSARQARWIATAADVHGRDQCGAAVRRAGDRRGAARGPAVRHRGVRGRRPAGRIAQAVERRASPAAITSNTAIPAWATRSPAGSASSWRCPDREVIVMVGDGSYLMMNSEIATSVMLGLKLIIVVLDNRGFGCINRLQRATGGESFNNLLEHARHETLPDDRFRGACREPRRDAPSKVAGLAELEAALKRRPQGGSHHA